MAHHGDAVKTQGCARGEGEAARVALVRARPGRETRPHDALGEDAHKQPVDYSRVRSASRARAQLVETGCRDCVVTGPVDERLATERLHQP